MNSYLAKKGFTLLEVLLSLSVVAVLSGLLIPAYILLQGRNDLDLAAQSVAAQLNRAQTLSQAVANDEQWGVYVQEGSSTLFQGSDYASRSAAFDEIIELSGNIDVSGTQEFVFAKLTGETEGPGSFTLISGNNETREITINEKGVVEY